MSKDAVATSKYFLDSFGSAIKDFPVGNDDPLWNKFLQVAGDTTSYDLTRNIKKYVMKLFFDFLEEQNEINKNPIPKDSVIKAKIKNPYKAPTYLEIEEIKKINKAILDTNKNEFTN